MLHLNVLVIYAITKDGNKFHKILYTYANPVRSLKYIRTSNDYPEREYIYGETPYLEVP